MRRLSLCLAAAVAVLVFVPAALGDGGPFLVLQGGSGVATHDGGLHYVAISNGPRATILEKVSGGQVSYWMPLRGSWGTPVVGTVVQSGQGLSRDGRTLVLASTAGPGSSPSRFLVLDTRRMLVVRTIVLRGSFSLDALSPDGSRLYLIQYEYGSQGDLTDYVVRDYDLHTGRLVPGKIADRSEHEQAMAGTPLTRTTSADGRWVYTLYQKPSGGAFVHALDTVGASAHCIDLPQNRALYDIALALRNHDRTLTLNRRSGRPWLRVDVGSWRVYRPHASFPWTWVGAGIGAALAIVAAAGAVLLLRRRRGEEVEERARHEFGLA